MSEEHKTERTRSWQAASPAACGSAQPVIPFDNNSAYLGLHGGPCNPRVTEPLRLGEPARTRRDQGSPVLKGHTAAVVSRGRPQGPTGGHRSQTMGTLQRLLERPLMESWNTKCHTLPSFLSFHLHRLLPEVVNSSVVLLSYL